MKHARAGFTLFEAMIAVSILSLVFVGFSLVVSSAQRSFRTESARMNEESQGSRALRRIIDALRTADFDSISAVPEAPFSAPALDFQQNLGYQGQQTEWSSVRRISVVDGRVQLTDNLGEPDEYVSTWCDGIAALQAGEDFNGADDNGNGLIDETGLAFSRQGKLLSVYITLEAVDAEGLPIVRTWSSSTSCRN